MVDNGPRLIFSGSPAGNVTELLDDMIKQGRMSRAEACVVMELIEHSEFPDALRRRPVGAVNPPAPPPDRYGTLR